MGRFSFMKLFQPIYEKVMLLARHRFAQWYLYSLSFVESFILPFPPPDVLLAPMAIAKPENAKKYAFGTTLSSIIGGVVGYIIGATFFNIIEPYIIQWGYQELLDQTIEWFHQWGFWAVLVAGFSPVPYKIFTISAGVLSLAIIPFLLASFIGRGTRFFLVALLLARYGPSFEPLLMKHIERIGWFMVGLLSLLVIYIALR